MNIAIVTVYLLQYFVSFWNNKIVHPSIKIVHFVVLMSSVLEYRGDDTLAGI